MTKSRDSREAREGFRVRRRSREERRRLQSERVLANSAASKLNQQLRAQGLVPLRSLYRVYFERLGLDFTVHATRTVTSESPRAWQEEREELWATEEDARTVRVLVEVADPFMVAAWIRSTATSAKERTYDNETTD